MSKSGIFLLAFCLIIFRTTSLPTIETEEQTSSLESHEGSPEEIADIGCPKENNNQFVTSSPHTAAVRCCSWSGINCITPGGHEAEQYGRCLNNSTFDEAEKKCAAIDMRLCTSDELRNNVCCGSGCNFDKKPTWQKREIKTLQDDEDEIIRIQKSGVDAIKQLLAFIGKTMNSVEAKEKISNNAIRDLKAETDSLDLEQFEPTKTFVEKFFDAKLNLLNIKRDLVSHASKIILLCKNIEINIESWQDDYATILLKNQFKQLARMIVESKTMLESTSEKFDPLIIKDIIKGMNKFNQTIDNALNKKSVEYKRWTKKIKDFFPSGIIQNMGSFFIDPEPITVTVTLGMIIGNISKCSGPCKGVFKTSTWVNSARTAEIAIKKYEERLKHFKNQIEIGINNLKELDEETSNALEKTNQKKNVVSTLSDSAENIKTVIMDLNPAQMKKVLTVKDLFKDSISDLKTAAQEFYNSARPEKPLQKTTN